MLGAGAKALYVGQSFFRKKNSLNYARALIGQNRQFENNNTVKWAQ